MNRDYITVTQLTKYIKYRIDNDTNLQEVYLKGEISNFKAHTRGHFYFTIKDENSRINAVMFASSARNVKFMPEDGMKVLVTGRISVYEATGGYQIYVSEMQEDGVGNLYVAFEQLKKKLMQEGLFATEQKKKNPSHSEKSRGSNCSYRCSHQGYYFHHSKAFPFNRDLPFPLFGTR